MLKDYTETESNPVISLLERNDSLELIYATDSTLFPKVIGLCDFERKGPDVTGCYESPDSQIKITYRILEGYPEQEILECEASAPLERWTPWRTKFPKDFIVALASFSPNFQINEQNILITLYQKFSFGQESLKRATTAFAQIPRDDRIITLRREHTFPTIVSSDIEFSRRLVNCHKYF